MWPSNRTEFLQELDATDEAHVRKKLALGGYTDWQIKVVEYWLQQRKAEREEARAVKQLNLAEQSARWTKVRVVSSLLGVALTVAIPAAVQYLSNR